MAFVHLLLIILSLLFIAGAIIFGGIIANAVDLRPTRMGTRANFLENFIFNLSRGGNIRSFGNAAKLLEIPARQLARPLESSRSLALLAQLDRARRALF